MNDGTDSGPSLEWLANALSDARTDPLSTLQRLTVREHPDQRYLVAAVRAYIATRIGMNDRAAALVVVESLEEGCPAFAHFVPDITSAHGELSERATKALVDLPVANSGREAMNYVSTLVDRGHGDSAAELFNKTILNTQAEASFYSQWTEKRAEVEADFDDWVEKLETARTALDESVGAARARLAQARGNLELLVDEVSEEAARELAADYATQSDLDETRARNAVRGAIVFLSLAVLTAIIFVIADAATNGSFSTTEVVSHATVSLTFLAIAGYCARLGGEYRRAMWHWRHTQLQLQRFFPFIGRLDTTDQALLITAMTPKFFPGQSDHPIGARDRTESSESHVSVTDGLTTRMLQDALAARSR